MTDTHLFDWFELMALSLQQTDGKPEFRFVDSQTGIRPNSYTQYTVPKDIADIVRGQDKDQLADVLSVSGSNRAMMPSELPLVPRAEYERRTRTRRATTKRLPSLFLLLFSCL